MSLKMKRMLGLIMVVLCVIVGMFTTRFVTRTLLLEQAHEQGANRLLTYVGDIRQTLSRFHHLPYLIAEHQFSVRLIKGDLSIKKEVDEYLTQLDKAANTKGWFLLDLQGKLQASSRDKLEWDPTDGEAIAQLVSNTDGEIVTFNYLAETEARYYLAAPIYTESKLIGIAVARVDLDKLADSWLASNERVLISDDSNKFFLSSSKTLPPSLLNQSESVKLSPLSLYDGTQTQTLSADKQTFLVQIVQFDDLKWHIYYLTPLKRVDQMVNWVGFASVIVLALLFVMVLFMYERHQKLKSKQQIQTLIAESEDRLRGVFSKTNVGLLLLSQTGKISYINPTGLRYFSLSETLANDIYAWQLFETFSGNSSVMTLLKELPKHRDIIDITDVEAMAIRSDGTHFPVLFSMTPQPNQSDSGFLVTILDISKRKKAENALKTVNSELEQRVLDRTSALQAAQDELVQNSKMTALGKMSSVITHELNQPLTGIKTLLSSSELLIERNKTDLLLSNMSLVNRLVDRMAGMTSQLKVFAYNQPETLVAVSIADALQETLRIHQQPLENVDVRVRMPSNLPLIQGNNRRLSQVLGNLIVNAVDALSSVTEPCLIISAVQQSNSEVKLEIIDNGCGVDSDTLQHLFEPFYTKKQSGDGLGLGLSITLNNVKEMRGTITGRNNHTGSGMTFSLIFLVA